MTRAVKCERVAVSSRWSGGGAGEVLWFGL